MSADNILYRACEQAAEALYAYVGAMPNLRPPQGVLSFDQQTQMYLAIKANPFAVAQLKIEKGPDAYARYAAKMEERLALMGKVNMALSDLDAQEREQILAAQQEREAAQSVTA